VSASEELVEFWKEWHLSTLTTLRPDGSPHVVPVGVTVDEEFQVARVICARSSVKARNVQHAGDAGTSVAVSQVDRGRWSTLEGVAVLKEDANSVHDAENRYAARYGRTPTPNPERVVIEISITRRLGIR
jgi:PPOX class probable F420-dependent enzyme